MPNTLQILTHVILTPRSRYYFDIIDKEKKWFKMLSFSSTESTAQTLTHFVVAFFYTTSHRIGYKSYKELSGYHFSFDLGSTIVDSHSLVKN
jgi:hypothetical protein